MPKHEQFAVLLPTREKVDVVIVELADGRIVARTAAELAHAPDDVRLAAGLPPLGSTPSGA